MEPTLEMQSTVHFWLVAILEIHRPADRPIDWQRVKRSLQISWRRAFDALGEKFTVQDIQEPATELRSAVDNFARMCRELTLPDDLGRQDNEPIPGFSWYGSSSVGALMTWHAAQSHRFACDGAAQ